MTVQFINEVTVTAPVNIAVIKYWGKRDTALLLPTNSSLSLTLSQDHLHSKTSIRASKEFSNDQLWLNGIQEDISSNKRFVAVLKKLREARVLLENNTPGMEIISSQKLHIVSANNFPTAAGLASSASGFAALTFCLAKLYQLEMTNSEISSLARLGSGSACRSLYGGFVAWEMGEKEDGTDSIAVQVAPESHWPDMEALILVASDLKKHVSSSSGMQTTVETSQLLQHRITKCVPERMQQMKQAILTKDFDSFAQLTMKDSNQFHSVCLDTFPPIAYLNATSFAVIQLITAYNQITATTDQKYKAAYTFDAGPNAVIYAPKKNMAEILSIVRHFFPISESNDVKEYYGRAYSEYFSYQPNASLIDQLLKMVKVQDKNCLKRVISTQIGSGPQVLARGHDSLVSLINVDGLPKMC